MESDRILARADEALRRHGATPRMAKRARQRERASAVKKLARIAGIGAVVGLTMLLWGLVIAPVGATGLMLAVLIFLIAAIASLFIPAQSFATGDVVPTTELAMLPLKTEEWLAQQRRALPAPAVRLVDGIGLKLEQLAPQLERLHENEPAAAEIRRLIGNELPELVRGYQRVPPNFRKNGLNGISPDQQLIDGLNVVDSEIARMSEQLATGDLNQLATQGRFLELKYQNGTAE